MRIYFYAQVAAAAWQKGGGGKCGAGRGLGLHRRDQSWAAAPVGSCQLEIGSRFAVGAGKGRAGLGGGGGRRCKARVCVRRSRSGSCLLVRHFVSFLCFADKCSRAYAAFLPPQPIPSTPAHPHICIELYLRLVAVSLPPPLPPQPLQPPGSQRILVAKLSHLRQQCRRGCRCNWSRCRSRSRFRRHRCCCTCLHIFAIWICKINIH